MKMKKCEKQWLLGASSAEYPSATLIKYGGATNSF